MSTKMKPNPRKFLIKKKILQPGNSYHTFTNGCKVTFHFQTRKTDKAKTLIDDSRAMGKNEPMVLVLGNKFKLEVWEMILRNMTVGEKSQFTVDKSLVVEYPYVSKTLRDLSESSEDKQTQCWAAKLRKNRIRYPDLKKLLANPVDLEFTIDLIKVKYPDDDEKDEWELSDSDNFDIIPLLKEKARTLFNEKNYNRVADSFVEAICYFEQHLIE